MELFLLFLSQHILLLACLKVLYICALILYLPTLRNVLIGCRSFLVVSLGSFMYKIIPQTNTNTLTFFCTILMLFISVTVLLP